MANDATRQELSEISELHSLFQSHSIDHWLMGGWAVDFHAGRITRDHDDIDFAVWLNDMPRLKPILESEGWHHSPREDENGGTGFDKGIVRLELTYLVRGEGDSVNTPLRERLVPWSKGALGTDVLQLQSANCRTVSFFSLQASKSSPRQDPLDAAKDRADLRVLLKIGIQPKSLGPGSSS